MVGVEGVDVVVLVGVGMSGDGDGGGDNTGEGGETAPLHTHASMYTHNIHICIFMCVYIDMVAYPGAAVEEDEGGHEEEEHHVVRQVPVFSRYMYVYMCVV